MANSRIYLKSEAGGTTVVSRDTSATSGNLVLPASGNVASVDTAVTDNAIVRYDGTTGKVQNSGVIIDDNNNVGIGTSNPSDRISIGSTNSRITHNGFPIDIWGYNVNAGDTMGIRFNSGYVGDNKWTAIKSVSENANANLTALSFWTSQSEKVRIDSSGNVGIGVTPSAWHSAKNVIELPYGTSISSYSGGGGETSISHNATTADNSTWKYKIAGSTGASRIIQDGTGSFKWYTAPSGTAGNTITWNNAMTLDAGGNLIVGQNNTIVTINARYDAVGSQTSIVARGTSNTDGVFQAAIGGVLKSAILANGTYQSATNVYGSTSDVKLKENVVETSDKLDKLMNVRVVNFNYIGDDQKQIGVIAQEVEKIFPGIVYETKDTEQVEVTKTKEVTDEEGNVTTEEYTETETVETGEVTKNVKYSVIYMMMLKAMQEMREEYIAEINDLKSRIEILEGAK